MCDTINVRCREIHPRLKIYNKIEAKKITLIRNILKIDILQCKHIFYIQRTTGPPLEAQRSR